MLRSQAPAPVAAGRGKRAAAQQATARLHKQASWEESDGGEQEDGGDDGVVSEDDGPSWMQPISGSQRETGTGTQQQAASAGMPAAIQRQPRGPAAAAGRARGQQPAPASAAAAAALLSGVAEKPQLRQAAVQKQALTTQADGQLLMSQLHRELDQAAASGLGDGGLPGFSQLGDGGLPGLSQFGSQQSGPSQPLGSQLQPGGSQREGSQRESLGFMGPGMLPLFKSRVAANPLATLNAR